MRLTRHYSADVDPGCLNGTEAALWGHILGPGLGLGCHYFMLKLAKVVNSTSLGKNLRTLREFSMVTGEFTSLLRFRVNRSLPTRESLYKVYF